MVARGEGTESDVPAPGRGAGTESLGVEWWWRSGIRKRWG